MLAGYVGSAGLGAVFLWGDAASSAQPLLAHALSSLTLAVPPAGPGASGGQITVRAEMRVVNPLDLLTSGLMHTVVWLHNPTGAWVAVSRLALTMAFDGVRLGGFDHDFAASPILLPPRASAAPSPTLCVQLPMPPPLAAVKALVAAAASPNGAAVFASGLVTFLINHAYAANLTLVRSPTNRNKHPDTRFSF